MLASLFVLIGFLQPAATRLRVPYTVLLAIAGGRSRRRRELSALHTLDQHVRRYRRAVRALAVQFLGVPVRLPAFAAFSCGDGDRHTGTGPGHRADLGARNRRAVIVATLAIGFWIGPIRRRIVGDCPVAGVDRSDNRSGSCGRDLPRCRRTGTAITPCRRRGSSERCGGHRSLRNPAQHVDRGHAAEPALRHGPFCYQFWRRPVSGAQLAAVCSGCWRRFWAATIWQKRRCL